MVLQEKQTITLFQDWSTVGFSKLPQQSSIRISNFRLHQMQFLLFQVLKLCKFIVKLIYQIAKCPPSECCLTFLSLMMNVECVSQTATLGTLQTNMMMVSYCCKLVNKSIVFCVPSSFKNLVQASGGVILKAQ